MHTAPAPHEGALLTQCAQASILVVEDPFIQKYLRTVLGRRGYQVRGADARSAEEMLRSTPEMVDLVITNSPRDFLAFARTLPLLYMSGAPDLELASRFLRSRVIRKPFHPDQLLRLVEDLTGSL